MAYETHSLFFYGTLCHAEVLKRVIGNTGAHLTSQDAVLLDHSRFHVAGEDYPAVVTAGEGVRVVGRPLSPDEASVRGVLYTGLTSEDVQLLDEFEGNEYTRAPCTVSPISASDVSSSASLVSASVYHWTAPLSRLEPRLWTFEAFLRDSAHRWVGAGSENNADYAEVDRRRAMAGVITPRGVKAEADKVEQELKEGKLEARLAEGERSELPKLGKEVREKYWQFEEGWVNLNHGAYGAAPRPVVERFRQIRDHIDAAPDRWMKVEYEKPLAELRQRIADFVDCDVDDLVMTNNTSVGVNTVVRSLVPTWQKGDRLLYISSSIYVSCAATLQNIVDSNPHLELSLLPIPIVYPISHDNLVATVRKTIEDAESDGTGRKVRLALIDAISSAPAVRVPWQRLVELFREKDVFSMVDAAHEIGQLPVSLRTSKPNAWVSNCHKWLMAHRGVAVLYIDKRYQHLIHTIPTSHTYAQRTSEQCAGWVGEFVWNGTLDWSPILSTSAALDFRRDVLGGEECITEYCHRLAVDGGELVAKELGTKVMRNEREEDGELIANMVNVELPLPAASAFSKEEQRLLAAYWIRELVEKHKTHVPGYIHNDRYYVRLSAQAYLDMDDFRYIATVLKGLCEKIARREFLQEERAEEKADGVETEERL
ncbi:hypothetical protein JCM8097_001404 [Rhodosporidiobolus ruineniae]